MLLKIMLKKKTLIVIAIVVLGIFILYFNNNFSLWKSVSPVIQDQKSDITKDWLLYENKQLGIAFKYPKQLRGQEKMVFFQVGSILFITTSLNNLYIHRSELMLNDDHAILEKASEIEKKYSYVPYNDGSWKIWILDAHSDNDLSGIIQDWFGKMHGFGNGCKFAGKMPSSQEGVYEVGIDAVNPGDGNDLFTSSCPINWRGNFVYSPKYQRAAIWDIGNGDGQFILNNCNNDNVCDADTSMVDSFYFINRTDK